MKTPLDRVVAEVRVADAPLRLRHLAGLVGVEESALSGMLDLLVRKGHLSASEIESSPTTAIRPGTACWKACPGPADCAFVAEVPACYGSARDHPAET